VPTLRAVRRSRSTFDPLFFEKSPLFWPIVRPARAFAGEADWPDVATYARVFEGPPLVRFEVAAPPSRGRRHRRASIDPACLYDARITVDACVPTRGRSWHDFLNALVWGAFPRSKRALHERQHRAIVSSLSPDATRLPGARSREHDALALLDEGGVVMLQTPGERVGVVFGHALYEGLVLGVRAMAARVVEARMEVAPEGDVAWATAADGALEERLLKGGLVPEKLPRIGVGEIPTR
jgi:hypothetical protein